MQAILEYFNIETSRDAIWLIAGLFAQLMFSMRFIVQWLASEKASESVVPVAFWWLSIAGGMLLLAYGISRGEPVIILGQSIGVVIYARNLWLIYKKKGDDQNTA